MNSNLHCLLKKKLRRERKAELSIKFVKQIEESTTYLFDSHCEQLLVVNYSTASDFDSFAKRSGFDVITILFSLSSFAFKSWIVG